MSPGAFKSAKSAGEGWRAAWHRAWEQRSPRERSALLLGALVLGMALLWQLLLAPALATWRMAPQKQAELDLQTQRMRQLDAQAQQLQAPARLPRQQALAWLEGTASALLGEGARLQVQGDQVQITLKAASASGLAQWLTQAREKAQALPHSVRLQRTPPARETVPGNAPETLWSGEMTLRLP